MLPSNYPYLPFEKKWIILSTSYDAVNENEPFGFKNVHSTCFTNTLFTMIISSIEMMNLIKQHDRKMKIKKIENFNDLTPSNIQQTARKLKDRKLIGAYMRQELLHHIEYEQGVSYNSTRSISSVYYLWNYFIEKNNRNKQFNFPTCNEPLTCKTTQIKLEENTCSEFVSEMKLCKSEFGLFLMLFSDLFDIKLTTKMREFIRPSICEVSAGANLMKNKNVIITQGMLYIRNINFLSINHVEMFVNGEYEPWNYYPVKFGTKLFNHLLTETKEDIKNYVLPQKTSPQMIYITYLATTNYGNTIKRLSPTFYENIVGQLIKMERSQVKFDRNLIKLCIEESGMYIDVNDLQFIENRIFTKFSFPYLIDRNETYEITGIVYNMFDFKNHRILSTIPSYLKDYRQTAKCMQDLSDNLEDIIFVIKLQLSEEITKDYLDISNLTCNYVIHHKNSFEPEFNNCKIGHSFSLVKSIISDKWLIYNDHIVHQIDNIFLLLKLFKYEIVRGVNYVKISKSFDIQHFSKRKIKDKSELDEERRDGRTTILDQFGRKLENKKKKRNRKCCKIL
ncbi:hypothetical protein SNEBB_003885 [Seison nebaliae]|nr:hypothetical protein SNEBB_003885 [Seison nebaliae]